MYTPNKKIEKIINNGIAYLTSKQEVDGNFLNYASPNPKNYRHALKLHSTFSTSLILDCLNSIYETPDSKKIKEKAAKFLLLQKSKDWSFNYWNRGSDEEKNEPYPDDLDDTFCALSALFRFDSKLFTGKVMASVVRILTATESKEGGPYKTWLVKKTKNAAWTDIDLAVNSNIGYFLSLHEITLPNINAFIEQHIKKNTVASPYYSSLFPIIYFISRFYKGQYTKQLQTILLSKKQQNASWGNCLHTALAISALLNLGASTDSVKPSIAYLLNKHRKFSWKPYSFSIHLIKKDTTYHAGSSALTTAFCLEALAIYLQKVRTYERHYSLKAAQETQYQKILQIIDKRFTSFSSDFKKTSVSFLQTLLDKNTSKQIPLMPFFFAQTFDEKKQKIPEDFLVKLGTANVFGWIAYTIYDNFLDNEGDTNLLSLANISLRELTTIFETILPKERGFQSIFREVMDTLDQANAWEVNHCRIAPLNNNLDPQAIRIPKYGKYEVLAHKSLGHGLGPLAILFYLGYNKNSEEVINFITFFKNYLITKQLNDDAHDWVEDLKKGQINPVSALLFKKMQLHNKPQIMPSDKLISHMQKIFWYEVIDEICDSIFSHANTARRALKKCTPIVDPTPLEHLLIRYEIAAQNVLQEKQRTLEFIKTY